MDKDKIIKYAWHLPDSVMLDNTDLMREIWREEMEIKKEKSVPWTLGRVLSAGYILGIQAERKRRKTGIKDWSCY